MSWFLSFFQQCLCVPWRLFEVKKSKRANDSCVLIWIFIICRKQDLNIPIFGPPFLSRAFVIFSLKKWSHEWPNLRRIRSCPSVKIQTWSSRYWTIIFGSWEPLWAESWTGILVDSYSDRLRFSGSQKEWECHRDFTQNSTVNVVGFILIRINCWRFLKGIVK